MFVKRCLILLGLAIGMASSTPLPDGGTAAPKAPLRLAQPPSKPIPDAYLVRFKDDPNANPQLDPILIKHWKTIGLDLSHKIQHKITVVWLGYTGTLTDKELEAVRKDPNVRDVEQDAYIDMELSDLIVEPFGPKDLNLTAATARQAKRAEQHPAYKHLMFDSQFDKHKIDDGYHYADNAGKDVDIYIVDSGVNENKEEFGSRLENLFHPPGSNFEDFASHGTCMASLAGGERFGTSKKAELWNVKVKTPAGARKQDLVAGLNQVADNKMKRKKASIINASIGTKVTTDVLEATWRRVHHIGIYITATAGNTNEPTKVDQYPALYDFVRVVAAHDFNYKWLSISKHGPVVDTISPGKSIDCLAADGTDMIGTGTSPANAQNAGMAALYLGKNKDATPADVFEKYIRHYAGRDFIEDIPDKDKDPEDRTPNRMTNNGFHQGFTQ